ncbi:stage V sporulation protein AA [Paenibacillus thalictri]|uniref:Stage V sporulation protein AA n=1 Tax=Paenibacillus thalictri TaxID=2527873 RepID=A0A4Q9DTY5_9BACL|nr:stage V sporulation protein AA [Paenibacillus thalictri]TBL79806.1 stage V sporulation protein AA [Paenibacillus thalictri]
MQERIGPTLYIRLRKRIRVPRGKPVMLGHVAQMFVDPAYEERLRHLPLIHPDEQDGNRLLIDMLMIAKQVKSQFPQLQIEHFGEPHSLIEVYSPSKTPNIVLVLLVWLLLFIGSGLAIMNFHADVSMLAVHKRLYQLLTGVKQEHPLLLQIPYSIGIGIGMTIFFNRLFKKKFNEEPSPLEVEMYMYQESVNQYVITEEYSKMPDQDSTAAKSGKDRA